VYYRSYTPADFPALYAIELACFQPPIRFSRRYMQRLIANPDSATWVAESKSAEEEAQITGFAIVNWAKHDTQTIAYIQTLEVAPTHRNRGIATELLHRLESSAIAAAAKILWLHVAETNAPAIRLYQAHGFHSQSREEDYYTPSQHALILSKTLP
jgi:ribosomal-protein-alanine N-acetyltransferase